MRPNVLHTFLEENLISSEKQKKCIRCRLGKHNWMKRIGNVYNPFRDSEKPQWIECTRCYKQMRCPKCDSVNIYDDGWSWECKICRWSKGYMWVM